jgi:hypothetical protein
MDNQPNHFTHTVCRFFNDGIHIDASFPECLTSPTIQMSARAQ